MRIFTNTNAIVFQSSIFQLNSTVITTDDLVLVVDPGYLPQEIEEIQFYVNKIKKDKPVYLFFTHSDYDHIVGYGAFPNAITIASSQFVESITKEEQLKAIIEYDDEFYIHRPYTIQYPLIDHIVNHDGEYLKIGNTTITFYQAIGHNQDGLLAIVEPVNLLIAGDYLSDLEFPFVYTGYDEYENVLATFRRLVSEKKNLILIPGHGSISGDTLEIMKRIDDAEEYFQFILSDPNDEKLVRFLQKKKYRYWTNLKKRHAENLQMLKDS